MGRFTLYTHTHIYIISFDGYIENAIYPKSHPKFDKQIDINIVI